MKCRLYHAVVGALAILSAGLVMEAVFTNTWLPSRCRQARVPALLFPRPEPPLEPAPPSPAPPPEPETVRVGNIDVGTGDVRATLSWLQGNKNDLDLHVIDPAGERIYYSHPGSASGGQLDVDANAAGDLNVNPPVENIFWPADGAPVGHYQVLLHYYARWGSPDPTPYKIEVVYGDETKTFTGQIEYTGGDAARPIYEFDFSRPAPPPPPPPPEPVAAAAPPPMLVELARNPWFAILASALWAMLAGLLLAVALADGLTAWIQDLPRRAADSARMAARGLFAGLPAGVAAQVAFAHVGAGICQKIGLSSDAARIGAVALLGGAIGLVIGGFTPYLRRWHAVLAGLASGAIAGVLLWASGPEAHGRLEALSLIGFAIGFMIHIPPEQGLTVEQEAEEEAEEPFVVVIDRIQPMPEPKPERVLVLYAGATAPSAVGPAGSVRLGAAPPLEPESRRAGLLARLFGTNRQSPAAES